VFFTDQAEVMVHHIVMPAPILPDIRVRRHPMHDNLYPARASAGRRFDRNRVHRSAAEVCPELHAI